MSVSEYVKKEIYASAGRGIHEDVWKPKMAVSRNQIKKEKQPSTPRIQSFSRIQIHSNKCKNNNCLKEVNLNEKEPCISSNMILLFSTSMNTLQMKGNLGQI